MMTNMPLRNILTLLTLSAIIGWFVVGFFLYYIPPINLTIISLSALYLSIFTASAVTLTIVGTLVRIYIFQANVPTRQLKRSLRQALFLATLVVLALFLSHSNLLTTWNLLLLILGSAFIELFFLSSRKK